MKCFVYIDESGDTGLKSVRSEGAPGASPYFVLAAVAMPAAARVHAKSVLSEIEEKMPKSWRHATELNHMQTVYFCRQAVKLNARFFAIVSHKATLNEYGEDIEWNPHKFYNKCSHYLLERVGAYMVSNGFTSEYPDVVFEDRNHDFDKLMRYHQKIKDNPYHTEAKHISLFNPMAFVTRSKPEEPLLKFADLAAHAVYQCVNKIEKNFFITEPRYYEELSSKFACDDKGIILGSGIKCIHSLDDIKLDPEVRAKFERTRATPRRPIARR